MCHPRFQSKESKFRHSVSCRSNRKRYFSREMTIVLSVWAFLAEDVPHSDRKAACGKTYRIKFLNLLRTVWKIFNNCLNHSVCRAADFLVNSKPEMQPANPQTTEIRKTDCSHKLLVPGPLLLMCSILVISFVKHCCEQILFWARVRSESELQHLERLRSQILGENDWELAVPKW